ncbi:multidrug efflux SMR transporter [Phenylobacterium sp. LjRoot219]|uniref:DMT family transporter n=1 Tax=Phenylobacterium sp. LjRoot219 TaxID=3342283 RepID=UPI003ECEC7E1
MAWISLVIAGILEVVWAYLMKQSYGFTRIVPTIACIVTMIASFGLLAFAMRTLPLGASYMIWTGIGAVGAFLAGIAWMGEPANLPRIAAALLIVSGLALMKLSHSA